MELARPTGIEIDSNALLHNLNLIKTKAASSQIIAMVKANAYGCGLNKVIPVLEKEVYAFGVACLEEALFIRALSQRPCILFQGIFVPDELKLLAQYNFTAVIHSEQQLQWILASPLASAIKVWIKVNTGMNRLGFPIKEVPRVLKLLKSCTWVEDDFCLLSHFACSDEPDNPVNAEQLNNFLNLDLKFTGIKKSMANSGAIFAFNKAHLDFVRPGIMLYGVSPFADKNGRDLDLIPVMTFSSAITAIHYCKENSAVGYGGTWRAKKPSVIAVVAAGYGDGYPRHIKAGTPVFVANHLLPIVGRVSMDMLTIDITGFPNIAIGDRVELWGKNIPIEIIAKSAGTIGYELLCQVQRRVFPENFPEYG